MCKHRYEPPVYNPLADVWKCKFCSALIAAGHIEGQRRNLQMIIDYFDTALRNEWVEDERSSDLIDDIDKRFDCLLKLDSNAMREACEAQDKIENIEENMRRAMREMMLSPIMKIDTETYTDGTPSITWIPYKREDFSGLNSVVAGRPPVPPWESGELFPADERKTDEIPVLTEYRGCDDCGRELSETLDAYYGSDPDLANLCTRCRGRR